MTLGECIQRADALRPNTAGEAEKARWVLELEGALERDFFPRYDAPRRPGPRRWPQDKAGELLASGPYEELYVAWLLAKLEWMDQEWESYNVHAALAARLESDFKKAWHRDHRRKPGPARVPCGRAEA